MLNGLLLPLLVAMFLGLNMGGSGTAPSFATAYGSGIIRRSLIPGLFGIFVLVGALTAGKNTAVTLGKEILPAVSLDYTLTTIILFSSTSSLALSSDGSLLKPFYIFMCNPSYQESPILRIFKKDC